MAGQLSEKDIKFMTNLPPKQQGSLKDIMRGPLSDKDIQFALKTAPSVAKMKRANKNLLSRKKKSKFVPGEIYSAKGKTGRN
tara:strand:+ start:283 stop:528 length:246 start_codon:yes stop_codon:yes gene_type:complete